MRWCFEGESVMLLCISGDDLDVWCGDGLDCAMLCIAQNLSQVLLLCVENDGIGGNKDE
jgi:hypothetical protein